MLINVSIYTYLTLTAIVGRERWEERERDWEGGREGERV